MEGRGKQKKEKPEEKGEEKGEGFSTLPLAEA